MKTKKIVKVLQLENKNQFVIMNNGKIYFQSYNSLIAYYNTTTHILTLGLYWDYSNTTRKHLYIFIKEYCYIYSGFSYDLDIAKNKRKLIQNLINNKKIKYDKNMK